MQSPDHLHALKAGSFKGAPYYLRLILNVCALCLMTRALAVDAKYLAKASNVCRTTVYVNIYIYIYMHIHLSLSLYIYIYIIYIKCCHIPRPRRGTLHADVEGTEAKHSYKCFVHNK